MLHRKLRGDKNPESTNKYTNFGQLIIRKIIKVIATKCHILKLECTKFYFRRLFVSSSVRLSLRWSLAHSADMFCERGHLLCQDL